MHTAEAPYTTTLFHPPVEVKHKFAIGDTVLGGSGQKFKVVDIKFKRRPSTTELEACYEFEGWPHAHDPIYLWDERELYVEPPKPEMVQRYTVTIDRALGMCGQAIGLPAEMLQSDLTSALKGHRALYGDHYTVVDVTSAIAAK